MPIDYAIASRFVWALTGHEHTSLTWQTFDDNEDRKKANPEESKSLTLVLHGPLTGVIGPLSEFNDRGAGIFYTVNETDGRGRAAGNIVGLRALFVDKDNGFIDGAKITLPPNIRIESSPGKEHALWLLPPGEDRALFTDAQKVLVKHFGADPKPTDLPRVLRLPGSTHRKIDSKKGIVGTPHFVANVWYGDGARHSMAEIVQAYRSRTLVDVPKLVAPPITPTVSAGAPGRIEVGGRNVALTSIAGRMRAEGFEHDAILQAITAQNATLEDPLPAAEIATIARSVARYEPKNDQHFNAAVAQALGGQTLGVVAPRVPEAHDVETVGGLVAPWTSLLVTKKNSEPLACVANGITVLEGHDAWRGVLALNVRAAEVWLMRPPPFDPGSRHGPYPRAVNDGDHGRIKQWFGYALKIGDFSLDGALLTVAQKKSFDPVVDDLNACAREWDGRERLSSLLAGACRAVGPPEYLSLVALKWCVQAVARAFWPGCQGDMTLILEGYQNAGKTSFFRVLAGEHMEGHMGENPPREVGGKAMQEFIRGPWIVEFGELSQFRRGEIEEVKAFLTNLVDRYRPAYGRTTGNFPRRCVFGGSTNGSHYLTDPTGNRRFAPIQCGPSIDVGWLRENRRQIWGEAVALYDAGVPWRVESHEIPLFAREQNSRVLNDALVDDIWKALQTGVRPPMYVTGIGIPAEWAIPPNPASVSVAEISRFVFLSKDHDPRLQARIATSLRLLDWRVDPESKRWVPPTPALPWQSTG